MKVHGNAALLSSVFHNLIDNAIAYSGGREVDLRLIRNDESGCTITVSDNGTGDEPQHLPRLFERFYQVDRGRSRQAGGTIFGLSIVRNAVHIHRGTISVDNKPAGSIVFTIHLPKV